MSSHDKHSVPAIVRIWKYIDNKLIKPWARNDWKIENDQEARKTVVESSIFSKRQATISEDAADPFFSIYYDHIPSRDHTPHRDIRVATDRGTELLLENDEFLIRDEQKNPGASSAEQSDDSEDE